MRVTLEPERGCELSHLRVFYAFERMQRADAPKGGRRLAAAGGGVGGGRIVGGRGEGGGGRGRRTAGAIKRLHIKS